MKKTNRILTVALYSMKKKSTSEYMFKDSEYDMKECTKMFDISCNLSCFNKKKTEESLSVHSLLGRKIIKEEHINKI